MAKNTQSHMDAGGLNLKVLIAHDCEWIKVDDVITYLKVHKGIVSEKDLHYLIVAFIRLKNKKSAQSANVKPTGKAEGKQDDHYSK